jgi:hypothetical protein
MDEKSKFLELLAVAVASGASIRSSANEIGCSESHAYHLSSTPEFRQRVAELRCEITSQSVGRLTIAATTAADTLLALLDASQAKY